MGKYVMNNNLELLVLYTTAVSIMENTNLDWEEKYDLIFSKDLSKRVFAIAKDSGAWYDPDTTYEEDVNAFFEQFTQYIKDRVL